SLRELKTISSLVDFSSNDYLGLARSAPLFDFIHQRLESIDEKKNGATGSRLLSGNSVYAEKVESKLKDIFKSESALIFNSGYSANLAVLSAIPQKDDTILYDELAHACIKDGARLSLASRHPFRHNDLNDLERKLKKATGKIFVAIESIYSMDGDESPLTDIVKLAESYQASIILDEAHSTGVMGEGGSGLAVSLGCQHKIGIRIYTFGKAMGIHGACVVGSSALIQYLINFARPFIYTTALPPHSLASIEGAFEYLGSNISLQSTLRQKVGLFLANIQNPMLGSRGTSAIQTAIFPGNDAAKKASRILQQRGFDVRPILSPTVPKGTERLRICLHTFNSSAEILSLTKALGELVVIS
ncbi:MAG: aminotransferase class I/II-fold pyridoxal phosphate-dependent enzyme, partial [Bacteroidota bacterium]